MFTQESNNNSPILSHGTGPTTHTSPSSLSSSSPWHPVHASPSENMWELPSSSSSLSSDDNTYFLNERYYNSSSAQQQLHDHEYVENFYIHQNDDRNERESMTTVMNTNNDLRREEPSSRLLEKKCVLGDATNTLRRKGNTSNTHNNINTRRIRRSDFN
mmetsp:Transcript_59072/g.66098  ORF Transcript_59072/g.66098 Transcript_59072/m.66098 type:complete len:159 (+) Transcript_59072:233-709(+)